MNICFCKSKITVLNWVAAHFGTWFIYLFFWGSSYKQWFCRKETLNVVLHQKLIHWGCTHWWKPHLIIVILHNKWNKYLCFSSNSVENTQKTTHAVLFIYTFGLSCFVYFIRMFYKIHLLFLLSDILAIQS